MKRLSFSKSDIGLVLTWYAVVGLIILEFAVTK